MSAPISFNQSIGHLRLTITKSLILSSLVVGVLLAVLSGPVQAAGQPANPFVILLSGPYKTVVGCPNLGLSSVNLCDGSYKTTKIFRVSGLPEKHGGRANGGKDDRETKRPIGNFYTQFNGGSNAVYDLPGGALAMVFTTDNTVKVPDGQGGTFFVGTLLLDITEATGIFQPFVGGHNQMVDILHKLADGTFVEHCFCIISRS